ncbi:alpha/beta fold hydrolase [Nesterenkonia haasae]|uniref:alpha/beta fold hydrolase n=1 Tax=Nesterenkonia haasae TaxID=2587813 RepID=UPI0013907D2A|nr:alpha/beta hydrolase [Nesterenkonia haasae]NDK31753.1 alpha/beta hydrolase [Nesterenkonia haasae]
MNDAIQYVSCANASIAYVDRPARVPAAGRPTLVFLHGGALDHRMWGPQLAAFAEHRCLALDARGHGWTQAPDGQPFRYGDDVVALLDALDIEKAVLVGVSMGGSTAVDVVLEHPDRALALVVSGAGTSEPEFRDPWVLDVLGAWQRSSEALDPEGWISAFMRFVAGPQRALSEVDPGVTSGIERMARHTLSTHIVREDGPVIPTPATPVSNTWQRLAGIDLPVLGVSGSLDAEDHQRMVVELATAVPRGEVHQIAGAAHYPNMERPDEFNKILLELVGKL